MAISKIIMVCAAVCFDAASGERVGASKKPVPSFGKLAHFGASDWLQVTANNSKHHDVSQRSTAILQTMFRDIIDGKTKCGHKSGAPRRFEIVTEMPKKANKAMKTEYALVSDVGILMRMGANPNEKFVPWLDSSTLSVFGILDKANRCISKITVSAVLKILRAPVDSRNTTAAQRGAKPKKPKSSWWRNLFRLGQ